MTTGIYCNLLSKYIIYESLLYRKIRLHSQSQYRCARIQSLAAQQQKSCDHFQLPMVQARCLRVWFLVWLLCGCKRSGKLHFHRVSNSTMHHLDGLCAAQDRIINVRLHLVPQLPRLLSVDTDGALSNPHRVQYIVIVFVSFSIRRESPHCIENSPTQVHQGRAICARKACDQRDCACLVTIIGKVRYTAIRLYKSEIQYNWADIFGIQK